MLTEPVPLTPQIVTVLGLLVLALGLFISEKLSVDVTTLLILSGLIISRVLTVEEAFGGFGSEIIVVIASIFVLSGALVRTGVMDRFGEWIGHLGKQSEWRLVVILVAVSASISAFLSNTTATAVLIPAVLAISKSSGVSASRLLMPVAFASMLGGTCTLIGTSANIAAAGFVQKLGLSPFDLFEFSIAGMGAVGIGTLYLALLGRHLLPRRITGRPEQDFQLSNYLSEVIVPEGSAISGSGLDETILGKSDLTVLLIVRDGTTIFPHARSEILEGDRLLVQGGQEDLLAIKESADLVIEAEQHVEPLEAHEGRIAEAIVMPQSRLAGRSLRQLRFRQRFGALVLAVNRRERSIGTGIRDMPLRVGDVLLLQGPAEEIDRLERSGNLLVLGDVDYQPGGALYGLIALASLFAAVLLGGTQLLPLSVAFLLAALLVIVSGCIPVHQVYTFVDWKLIVLIGGMSAFGVAMEKTSAAHYLAQLLVAWAEPLGSTLLLGGLMALTTLLTQPLSNAAAVLVMLPVAVSTAQQMGLNPRGVAILVTLAGSLSFVAPFEPACLLVFGAGRYRFRDFVLLGLPLTLLIFLWLLWAVPRLWPLGPFG